MSNARQIADVAPTLRHKNRVHNPCGLVDQWAGGVANVHNTHSVDRWTYMSGGLTGEHSFSNAGSATLYEGTHKYHLYVASKAAAQVPTANQYLAMAQVIEGYYIADLAWGTAAAKPVTLSFRAELTGWTGSYPVTVGVSLRDDTSSVSYVIPVVFTDSSTHFFEFTVPGPTTGTWNELGGRGIQLWFTISSGSSYTTATTNQWTPGNYIFPSTGTNMAYYLDAALRVTNIQLEEGIKATPFELRTWAEEWQLCARYAEKSVAGGKLFFSGNVTSGSNYYAGTIFRVPKRVSPTVSMSNIGYSATFTSATPTGWSYDAWGFVVYKAASGTGMGYWNTEWFADSDF